MTANAKRRVVTVFGSSRIAENSPDYDEAYRLGLALAKNGYVVANGGYNGAMAAVSRGASDGGGHAIGMTLNAFGDRPANSWLGEEVRSETLILRLEALVEHGDAFIALPGGIGTLLEIALVWNLALIQSPYPKPLILVGEGWRKIVSLIERTLVVGPDDIAKVHCVGGIEEAIHLIETVL